MTIKKFLILSAIILISLSAEANSDYMNFGWWEKYNDEILNTHLHNLYENNHDLKISAYKTKQAQENIRLIGANQFPQASFLPEVTRSLHAATTRFGDLVIPDYSQTRILLPIEASYEVDIWGENYLNKKSAKKQKEMVSEDERAAYIYVTSNFVSAYFNLIKADKMEELSKEIVDLQTEIVKMTEKKYSKGLCSINELLNAKQILLENEKVLNTIIERKKVLNNQLLSILGENSEREVEHSSIENVAYPDTPDSISAIAVQTRPDVIKSERYAQKVGIDVRVAKREFLPKFIVYGNIGFNAYNKGSFFSNQTFLSNVGVLPRWDIFSGGAKLANYRINKYEYKKADEAYQQTILNGIQELNNALAQAKTTKANLKKSEEDYNLETRKYSLSEKEYLVGNSSKLDVLKSKIELLLAEQKHISSLTDDVISTISLYDAVGGADYTKINNL